MTPHRKKTLGTVFLLLTILSPWLHSCNSLEWVEPYLPKLQSVGGSETLVKMTFFVQVPPETPTEEPIFLSTLDEVTGIGVHAEAHPMEPVFGESSPQEGLTYKTTLSIPQHSLIKYRYTRRDQYSVIEHTDTDEQVRYRMLHAVNPGEVHDVVYRWSDTTYSGPEPGRISGRITDQKTGQPLPGILVAAGGVQAHTTASGSFLLSGLPPGIHNLVAYALDGSYDIAQQGAQVASQANTEAILELTPREHVDITFVVEVPRGTPQDSVRLAGNLYQLGNTFGNFTGGMNTLPARMPILTKIDETHYGIILSLPVGAEIHYKYTLGDGFWNAEHKLNGEFRIRRFLVPDKPVQLNDTVATWSSGENGPITFDLTAPSHTPANERIYIQFNPFGWTTPIPMLQAGPNHWVYILYSPLNIISDLRYRYCRGGECGVADDGATRGDGASGREVTISTEGVFQEDQVEEWAWLNADLPSPVYQPPDEEIHRQDFMTGVELMPGHIPAQTNQLLDVMKEISALHAGWVTITPTWSFTHQKPPVLEPKANQDLLWLDLKTAIHTAKSQNLKVALYPHPHFPSLPEDWWLTASRDFGWWNSWFDQYRRFALHFADAAQEQNLDILVLGGAWLEPALPGGTLKNVYLSGVPADAELRWERLLEEVKEHFDGTIAWAMPLPTKDAMPRYFKHIDQVFLLWSPPLTDGSNTSLEEKTTAATKALEEEVLPLWEDWFQADGKELILSVAYPSVEGGSAKCLPIQGEECLPPSSLSTPGSEIPGLSPNFQEQAQAYQAVLAAVYDKEWLSGLFSRGYYAPVVLHDPSISIHGKPAAEVIRAWFGELAQ
ncbi:MAG: hypothetical protein R6U57_06045 [Anaerolineales bacterium]